MYAFHNLNLRPVDREFTLFPIDVCWGLVFKQFNALSFDIFWAALRQLFSHIFFRKIKSLREALIQR